MITTATPPRQRAGIASRDGDTRLVITTEDLQLTVDAIEPGVTYETRLTATDPDTAEPAVLARGTVHARSTQHAMRAAIETEITLGGLNPDEIDQLRHALHGADANRTEEPRRRP